MVRPVLSGGEQSADQPAGAVEVAINAAAVERVPSSTTNDDVVVTFPAWDLLPPAGFVDRTRKRN